MNKSVFKFIVDDRMVGKKRKLDIKNKIVGISEDVIANVIPKEYTIDPKKQMDVEIEQQQQRQIGSGQQLQIESGQQTFYNALPIAASLLPRRYPKNTRLRKLL